MKIWAITANQRGADVQCMGVADALGGDTTLIHVDPRPPWKWFAPFAPAMVNARRDARFAAPFPDIALSAGRQAAPYLRWLRRLSGGQTFCVCLQDARLPADKFDFVWAPLHDRIDGPNVMKTLTSPHGLTPALCKTAADAMRADVLRDYQGGTIVSVLIGGPNDIFAFGLPEMRELAAGIGQLARAGAFPLITLSRRSPPAYAEILRAELGNARHYLWDGQGDNPYRAMLGLAEAIIVTADSVNMTGEACALGVPVQVFSLDGGSRKFNQFHADMMAAGYTRPFQGTLTRWKATPVNVTSDIAAEIKARRHAQGAAAIA